jgi:hypothetical protein
MVCDFNKSCKIQKVTLKPEEKSLRKHLRWVEDMEKKKNKVLKTADGKEMPSSPSGKDKTSASIPDPLSEEERLSFDKWYAGLSQNDLKDCKKKIKKYEEARAKRYQKKPQWEVDQYSNVTGHLLPEEPFSRYCRNFLCMYNREAESNVINGNSINSTNSGNNPRVGKVAINVLQSFAENQAARVFSVANMLADGKKVMDDHINKALFFCGVENADQQHGRKAMEMAKEASHLSLA